MEKTIFEKIIIREIPAHVIYEDTETIAILDIQPKTLGHTLVIPKLVSRNFLEMPTESIEHYFKVVQKVAQAITKALSVDGCNILLNNNETAWQEVFHTHTHIIPRQSNDMVTLDPGIHRTYSSQDEMEEYVFKIKTYLS